MSNLLAFAILLLVFAASAYAQTVEPKLGSPMRKAILDSVRRPVETDLKQRMRFTVDRIKVSGNWAFIGGSLKTLTGGEPNFRKTKYRDAVAAGAFDNNVFSILRKTNGTWKVVTYAIGCTDVCYADWWSRYGAPKAIFPHTE